MRPAEIKPFSAGPPASRRGGLGGLPRWGLGFWIWGFLFLFLLIFAGCSKEDPPVPPPPPPKPAPPEPPLPALGDVKFRDWSEVDDEKFLDLPAPLAAPDLKWDFSAGQRYGYDFS